MSSTLASERPEALGIDPIGVPANLSSSNRHGNRVGKKKARTPTTERLKGFAAGTASGLTKLCIGHPFECASKLLSVFFFLSFRDSAQPSTVKTRLQCSPPRTYSGPLECLTTIIKGEGLRALYKGASPPGMHDIPLISKHYVSIECSACLQP